MTWLRAIGSEVFGLFVDDGAFATAITVWLVALWWLLPRVAIEPFWKAVILASGLLAILLESVLRRARAR